MSSLRNVEWEACLLEPKRSPDVHRVQRQYGRIAAGNVAYFADCPAMAQPLAAVSTQLNVSIELEPDLMDMVGAVVSHDNSCRYCYAASRALLRALGHSEERIRKLQEELLTADFSPHERAALELARRISRANPLPSPDDAKRLLDAGFSDTGVKEVAACAAVNIFLNRLSTLAALPPEQIEELPDRWFARLLRALFGLLVRQMHRRVSPVYLDEQQKQGPFADVVCALDGLPVAPALRRLIDTLWEAPGLPARSKALVFGVVARGLGCGKSEADAAGLAVREGLSAEDVDAALVHLTAPALDDVEKRIVPFARETIWYQPAAIQRRSRELRDVLPRQQYVELLITASAANMICRLCPALLGR